MPERSEPITERRRLTRNALYQYLYRAEQPRSKQEIARDMALSLPTVHQNLTELMEAGLVCMGGVQQSTGGRRAMGFSIVPDARFAVGIAITADGLRLMAADLKLAPLAYQKTSALPLGGADEIGSAIAAHLESFLDHNHLDRARMLGVGVAVPAVPDAARRNILLAPTLRLKNFSIQSLRQRLPYPSLVENDGSCGGYAEWFLEKQKADIAYLSLEDGIGGTVLLQGAPYSGSNGRSGEFGHITVEPGGLTCHCGKSGCMEAYCSPLRIRTELGLSPEAFFEKTAAGEESCCALWQDMMEHLALGINTIRMMLDCDVVLGGYFSQYLAPYLPEIRRLAAARNTFEDNADYIRLGQDPRFAVVRGAALHYLEAFLESI